MSTPTLRDFQAVDVAAVLAAWAAGHRTVLMRAATGLGKAVELAFLAKTKAADGRVLILVDTRKLVRQLAATVRWVTGIAPGVEMGDERAANGRGWAAADRIVIGTVQTQFAGPPGKENFRQFDPAEFAALLLDETELFLAPKSRGVVDYYLDGNPGLVCAGCTATPCRTDGVAMGNLFAHAAVDRDILWGIENGWLVKPRQGFVRVSLDLSTLKVKKGADGEADFSEDEIADRLNNERTLIELAKGVVGVAGDRRTIVVCPKVTIAKAVADYLNAERAGSARCIYGELSDDEKDSIFDGHQRGEFQYLTSVGMLVKGYDDPQIRCVVNCRKTKSKRLYTQVVGRGTRPLKGVVDGLATPEERRAAIAASAKPDVLMVNMVGISRDVRDFTLVDLLGGLTDEQVAARAKELADAGADTDEAIAAAAADVAAQRQQFLAECVAAAEAMDAADLERSIRAAFEVQAKVHAEFEDDRRVSAPAAVSGPLTAGGRIPDKHANVLRKAKFTEAEIARLSPEEAAAMSQDAVRRWKGGYCSLKQARCLERFGWSKDETHAMSFDDARAAIDALKANNWQRPSEAA